MPRIEPSPPPPSALARVGVVAIGRNEGERLRSCLDSLPAGIGRVVYVDSASTDDSVALARGRGIDVVELDLAVPFTAARARNAGLRRLLERSPGLELVQFVDGDCALVPGWLPAAQAEIATDPRLAVVCGRRREVNRNASPYNRLCDMEWDTPVGSALDFGGDALARVAALREVGGYDDALIAGEDTDLCARLRARGWAARRVAHDMTLHDAAMSRFGQWWRRAVRGGHAYAEVSARHPPFWRRERRSILAWTLVLPAAVSAAAPVTGGLGLLLLLGYPALWARIALHRRARGDSPGDAAIYGGFCVLGKFPQLAGMARYAWNRWRGRRSGLIEYK